MGKGAVGRTEHPFTLNFSSQDVRVTNHYHEHNPISAIFSAIHEGGHGIFEQNVNPEYDGTVAGSCCYMGIHESQSRFYENMLGRNKNFWMPIYDKLGDILPQFRDISLDEFSCSGAFFMKRCMFIGHRDYAVEKWKPIINLFYKNESP